MFTARELQDAALFLSALLFGAGLEVGGAALLFAGAALFVWGATMRVLTAIKRPRELLAKLPQEIRFLLGMIRKHGAGVIANVPPRGADGAAHGVSMSAFHSMLDRMIDLEVIQVGVGGSYEPTPLGKRVIKLVPEHDGTIAPNLIAAAPPFDRQELRLEAVAAWAHSKPLVSTGPELDLLDRLVTHANNGFLAMCPPGLLGSYTRASFTNAENLLRYAQLRQEQAGLFQFATTWAGEWKPDTHQAEAPKLHSASVLRAPSVRVERSGD